MDAQKSFETENTLSCYIEISISNITKKGRYVIIASVIDTTENSIEVNDGSESLEVSLSGDFPKDNFTKGMQLRIFGIVEDLESKVIKPSIIQDVTSMDYDLYQRIRDLEETLSE